MTKGIAYHRPDDPMPPSVFDTGNKEEHRRKRKLVGSLLTDRAVRGFETTLQNEINIFLRELLRSSQAGKTVNLTPRCVHLTMDIICHMGFGYPLKTQTERTNRVVPVALFKVLRMTSLFFSWPAVAVFGKYVRRVVRKRAAVFHQTIEKMVQARLAMPKNARNDIWSMMEAGDEELVRKNLKKSELWSEALVLFVAGEWFLMVRPLLANVSCQDNGS
jgi:cytochrome P450